MKLENYQDSIFIVKQNEKKHLIKKISEEKKLINIKVCTIDEIKRGIYFSYDKKTIHYITEKYKVNPVIAKIYIENMYYINDEVKNVSGKTIFLDRLKSELIEKKLLYRIGLFKKSLENKKIVLYNLGLIDKFYENMMQHFDIEIYEDDKDFGKHPIYKSKSGEEEISFVASQIVGLIKSGVKVENIFLANVQDDYYFLIKHIFDEFNIPVSLPNKNYIKGTNIVKVFKENYSSDIVKTLDIVKGFVKSREDEDVYDALIDLVNSYAFASDLEEVREELFLDLEKLIKKGEVLKRSVRTISLDEDIDDESFIFLINFNEGVIPNFKKDEDYLSDSVKKKIGVSTSEDINKKNLINLKNKIKRIKNLTVTYKDLEHGSKLYISNAYDKDLFTEKSIEIGYNDSNRYNRRVLLCMKDEYKKYGTKHKDLSLLNSVYNIDYASFDNRFKGINKDKLSAYLNNKLTLSYSSMNTYYLCAYRYYIEYILRLDKYEDNFSTVIGNIYHEVLSKAFREDFDFDDAWNKAEEKIKYKFDAGEEYFLTKLKKNLVEIIDVIKKQIEYTDLHDALYEQEVIIDIGRGVSFKGFIDKVLYDKDLNIACVIDYKTGNPEVTLKYVNFGLEMQLPIYIYLIKKSGILGDAHIGGFYLQKILNTKDTLENDLKLEGYTNSSFEILEHVDKSFSDSKVIKSMKTASSGSISGYAKVLSSKEMDDITKEVERKVLEASSDILNGNFTINPKEIDNKMFGCKFCKFRDLCFKTNKDIVKYKTKEENNAEVD